MPRELLLIAHVLNRAVTDGFVPAAHNLGYRVTLITDHGRDYGRYYQQHPALAPAAILECDVFNPLAIVACAQAHRLQPQLVFSNSDHLQTATALVANYFDLPAKDWRCCYRAKNKSAMREHLAQLSLPSIWAQHLRPDEPLPTHLPVPLIAKPSQGVSGLHVVRCDDVGAVQQYRENFYRENPAGELLLEGLLEGPLFTLETLGDGELLHVIGGFDVTLSAPPHFVELQAQWQGPVCRRWQRQAVAQISQFGVGLGACHSEFIATEQGPVLVEINYRSVGDQREFMLNNLLPFNWFEAVLKSHSGAPMALPKAEPQHALIRYLPATQSGRIKCISGACSQLNQGIELNFQPLMQAGDWIQLSHSNKDYLGVVTAQANSESVLPSAVDQFAQQLTWEIQA